MAVVTLAFKEARRVFIGLSLFIGHPLSLAFKEARRVFIGLSLFVGHPLRSLALLLVKNAQKKVGGRKDNLFKPLIGQKQPGGL
jgi:hypothetical protein